MPQYWEQMTSEDWDQLPRSQTLVLVPLYAPQLGSAPLLKINRDRSLVICEQLAARVESEFKDWKVLITPPQLYWREGLKTGAPGWALRDVVQGYVRSLSGTGLKWFGMYAEGTGPGGLTLIEEVGRRLRFRKIKVLSLASALHPWERVKKNPFEWMRKPDLDLSEPIETILKTIEEPLFEMLRGVPQRNRFRTWYSVLPPNSSTFKLWFMTVLAIAAMIAMLNHFLKMSEGF